MQPVFGLYTHIQANRRKSIVLVAGLFGLVFLVTFAVALLVRGLVGGDDAFAGHVAGAWRDLLWASPVVIVATGAWVIGAYHLHQWIIDAVTGARAIGPADDPRLHDLLENLCISRGMTMPHLKILETEALNAYASGLTRDQSTITVTRGLLDHLDDAELEAVLAHELTHIRNEDVRLMVVAVIVAGIIAFVGELIFRGGRDVRIPSRSSDSDRKRGGGGALAAILVALLIIAVAWGLSQLIRYAISRSREFMADAGAVELTKNPDALISALLKIQGRGELQGVPSGIMEMCVDNPNLGFIDLFASHPPIEDRIDALVRHAGGHRPVVSAPAVESGAETPAIEASPWGPASA